MNDNESLNFFTEWIDRYLNFEKTPKKNIFWLDTMKFLCEKLNHPEKCCPCIHVAGSKGKGSISTMIAGILEANGLKTGIYTSPHILDFKERVGYYNKSFDFEVYKKSAEELMTTVESIPLNDFPLQRPVTWFELVTLFAMLCFRNANVDFAVWEVGLGGRLDATNVVSPECCCIGPIELEHTEYLGDTIEKIAAEKGGIIKTETPVISAPQCKQAESVLKNIAELNHSKIFFINENTGISDTVYNFTQDNLISIENNTYKNTASIFLNSMIKSHFFKRELKISLKMFGDVQVQNAAVAALAVKQVFPDIEESVIEEGLAKVSLPARFEIISSEIYKNIPFIVLDGAHTANSIKYTVETYDKIFSRIKINPPNLLFACAADKDIEDITEYFRQGFNKIILTRPGDVKQSNLERAEKAFSDREIKFTRQEDFTKAIEQIFIESNATNTPLLVTGSFYLIAEVKKYLLNFNL